MRNHIITILFFLSLTTLWSCENTDTAKELIFEVQKVEFSTMEGKPESLRVIVTGIAASVGWSDPELLEHVYIQAPEDGMYGFDFVAVPPSGIVAQVLTPITAEFIYARIPSGFNGVKISAKQGTFEARYTPPGDPQQNPSQTNVLEVSDVAFVVTDDPNPRLKIVAHGYTEGPGWTAAQLIPRVYVNVEVNVQAPRDGIYDYEFVATPPAKTTSSVKTPIRAEYILDGLPDAGFGVNIVAANNSLVARYGVQKLTPIMRVNDVELLLMESFPPQLVIAASGFVSSGGWSNPQLEPAGAIDTDGVLTLNFKAVAPTGIVTQALELVTARYIVAPLPDQLKKIRVIAASNEITKELAVGLAQ